MIFTPGQLNRRAELYNQLGSMISAGVSLIEALQMAATNSSLRVSRKVIVELVQHLKNGLTLSDSMVRVHGWLPEFDVALLSAGEHSGRLDYCFKQLGMYYATRAAIIRETISGLMRTAITFHVFLFLFPLGFFFNFVLGIVNNNYARCLPFIIEKVIAFGLLYGIVFFLIFACQGHRGERWRSITEHVTQAIPILRSAQKYLVISRLCAALEALVSSGVSIVKGWSLAAAASGSPHLKRTVEAWKVHLEGGSTPAELVSDSPYFPEMFVNLYHTGEVSGKLDESLGRLHTYFREEGFLKLRTFTRVLNGVLYGLVAILVAYNVIRFWVNYFNTLVNSA
ncbi:MAG TPA: type II secretion system F family protein [Verrucomicrobiae bacterium]|nr:type II secretion system F family protein [Verrucomicrobiae bacterium]